MHIDFEDKIHEPNTQIVSLSGFYLEDTGVRPELDLPYSSPDLLRGDQRRSIDVKGISISSTVDPYS